MSLIHNLIAFQRASFSFVWTLPVVPHTAVFLSLLIQPQKSLKPSEGFAQARHLSEQPRGGAPKEDVTVFVLKSPRAREGVMTPCQRNETEEVLPGGEEQSEMLLFQQNRWGHEEDDEGKGLSLVNNAKQGILGNQSRKRVLLQDVWTWRSAGCCLMHRQWRRNATQFHTGWSFERVLQLLHVAHAAHLYSALFLLLISVCWTALHHLVLFGCSLLMKRAQTAKFLFALHKMNKWLVWPWGPSSQVHL